MIRCAIFLQRIPLLQTPIYICVFAWLLMYLKDKFWELKLGSQEAVCILSVMSNGSQRVCSLHSINVCKCSFPIPLPTQWSSSFDLCQSLGKKWYFIVVAIGPHYDAAWFCAGKNTNAGLQPNEWGTHLLITIYNPFCVSFLFLFGAKVR